MNLWNCEESKEYLIKAVKTGDEELDAFLFSLGCYENQPITVVSKNKSNCVLSIKEGRYNVDRALAEAVDLMQ